MALWALQLSQSLGKPVGGFHEACHDLARALSYELLHPLNGHLITLAKSQLLLHDVIAFSLPDDGQAWMSAHFTLILSKTAVSGDQLRAAKLQLERKAGAMTQSQSVSTAY